ncbi:uncharacterized protein LOC107043994 [Diachasma alloeum]|uniref:uncharacterized protein LOC107043994 n=1 Tax=Diachasma alloeum TaxID=454923 RepID=UPI00073846D2|nr:uncharacterized protein LOC107043994 [Diachasma alloeum]
MPDSIEGQFHLSGIKDEVPRYYYASPHLDPKAAAEVQDILLNVPTETPYTRLKEALVECLTLSRDVRLQQLLDRDVLDDRKPSQFLRHLRSLDDTVPDNILRTKWLRRLPMTTQSLLASQADMALDRLAILADKLHEIALPVAHINDVQEPTSSALETCFCRLEAIICELASALKGQSVGANVKGSHPVAWTPEGDTAFTACKEELRKATLVIYPDTTLPWAIFTDASEYAIGAVLQQRRGQHWEPLACFS